jgi:hypothetical protein
MRPAARGDIDLGQRPGAGVANDGNAVARAPTDRDHSAWLRTHTRLRPARLAS